MTFGIARFALNEGIPAAAPVANTGVATSTEPSITSTEPSITSTDTAGDVFDKVAEHFGNKWRDPNEMTNNEDPDAEDIFGDKEGDNTQEGDEVNQSKTERKLDPTPKEEQEGDFKPYTFKAEVDGKEVERVFKSPEELNQALAKAEVAPRLFKEAKKLRTELEALRPDAELANDMIGTAKNEPLEFLKLMEEDLIPMQVLSEWVYDKYHEFAKIANMTPEQQEAWHMKKEAEKIVAESRYQRQLKEEADRVRHQQTEVQEIKAFSQWADREKGRWHKDVPKEYHDNVLMAMKTVVAYARREIDNGEEVSFKRMSGMLNTLLGPYKRSMSPAQREREVAKSVADKKAQATSTLQRAVQGASSTRNDVAKGKMAYSIEDIFDGATAALQSGRNKWRD